MILFLIRKLGKELIRKIKEAYFILKIYLEIFWITIITDLCHFDTSLINTVLMNFLVYSLWIAIPSFIKAQPNSNVFSKIHAQKRSGCWIRASLYVKGGTWKILKTSSKTFLGLEGSLTNEQWPIFFLMILWDVLFYIINVIDCDA